jgi:hypothetical protein
MFFQVQLNPIVVAFSRYHAYERVNIRHGTFPKLNPLRRLLHKRKNMQQIIG